MRYPGLLGSEDEEQGDVDGLYDATSAIDGDEEIRIGLDQCVVDHQHGAEERDDVGNRLEPLRGLLLAYPVERRAEVPSGAIRDNPEMMKKR